MIITDNLYDVLSSLEVPDGDSVCRFLQATVLPKLVHAVFPDVAEYDEVVFNFWRWDHPIAGLRIAEVFLSRMTKDGQWGCGYLQTQRFEPVPTSLLFLIERYIINSVLARTEQSGQYDADGCLEAIIALVKSTEK